MNNLPLSSEEEVAELYRSVNLPGKQWIRLLDLQPGKKSMDIKVRLEAIHLAELPPRTYYSYEALSYVWGATTEGRSIIINDVYRIPVTDNLFRALRGLRYHKKIRNMWVDKLCINQDDLAERAQQVTLMGQIYSRAFCVNVWIGEPQSWTCPISLVSLFNMWQRTGEGVPVNKSRSLWCILRNHHRSLAKALEESEPRWDTRAWTAQEFILGRAAFICFGSHRISYDSLWQLDTGFSQSNGSGSTLRSFYTSLERMTTLGLPLKSTVGTKPRLHEVAGSMQQRNATNPLDHVYSLLGMLPQEDVDVIKVDYTLADSELFCRVTFEYIKHTQQFDIFNLINIKTAESAAILPSWCVDFAAVAAAGNQAVAFRNPSISVQPTCNPVRSNNHLTIQAAFVDTVVDVLNFHSDFTDVPDRCNFKNIDESDYDRVVYDHPTAWLEQLLLHVTGAARRYERSKTRQPKPAIVEALSSFGHEKWREGRPEEPRVFEIFRKPSDVSWEAAQTIGYYEKFAKFTRHGHNTPLYKTGDGPFQYAFILWSNLTRTEHRFEVAFDGTKPGLYHYLPSVMRQAQFAGAKPALITTTGGLVALGPSTVSKGDVIVQVPGGRPWIALRHESETHTYRGQLWIHGLMDGFVVDNWRREGFEENEYTLS